MELNVVEKALVSEKRSRSHLLLHLLFHDFVASDQFLGHLNLSSGHVRKQTKWVPDFKWVIHKIILKIRTKFLEFLMKITSKGTHYLNPNSQYILLRILLSFPDTYIHSIRHSFSDLVLVIGRCADALLKKKGVCVSNIGCCLCGNIMFQHLFAFGEDVRTVYCIQFYFTYLSIFNSPYPKRLKDEAQ